MRKVYPYLLLTASLTVAPVSGGNLDAPSGPGVYQTYTLEDLYNRLNAGTAGSQSTFTEPAAGPGSTSQTLNEVMGVAPAVDDTNGAEPGDVGSGKTYWGLKSGQWGLQIGTQYPAPVPKSGQTTPITTGDDGDLEKGVAWPNPRFTNNADGTVTDNLTGLIWLKNANCSIFFSGDNLGQNFRGWSAALAAANGLSSGHCDLSEGSIPGTWRLPNIKELLSLVDFGRYSPSVPSGHPFTGVQSNVYWSSTTNAGGTTAAWSVDFSNGRAFFSSVASGFYVWPVRGGQ